MFNKIKNFFASHPKITYVLLFALITFCVFKILDTITYTYISADFKNLRPTKEKLYVYFKGYRIGKVLKIQPAKDYTTSRVEMVLYPRDLFLPANITALLKHEGEKSEGFNFIELEYPASPSVKRLKSGMVIEGDESVDIRHFLANQDPETLNKIKDNVSDLSGNINDTVTFLGDFFETLNNIANENRPNILQASKNLADTTNNLKEVTEKLNSAMTQERLNNTVANIDATSQNAQQATKDIQLIVGTLDNTTQTLDSTMPKVDTTVSKVQNIVSNVDIITTGIRKTLQKRFGAMKLLLGKPVEEGCP